MADHYPEMVIEKNNMGRLQQLAIIMRVYVTPVMEQIGHDLTRKAVNAIEFQTPPGGGQWESLSPRYVSWKKRKGYSTNLFTVTSTYMQNITHVYNPATMTLEVGLFRGVMHPGIKGIRPKELWNIAEILEFGKASLHIPARPLWRPLLEDNDHAIRTKIGIAISQALKYTARYAGGLP